MHSPLPSVAVAPHEDAWPPRLGGPMAVSPVSPTNTPFLNKAARFVLGLLYLWFHFSEVLGWNWGPHPGDGGARLE